MARKSVSMLCIVLLLLCGALTVRAAIPFEKDDTLEELRQKIEQNGYNFTVTHTRIFDLPASEKKRYFFRRVSPPPLVRDDAGRFRDMEIPAFLPSAYDSRNVDGHSSIGPVRDQGACGSCYAFGALAAAEGAYNTAYGLVDDKVVDFSEAFVVWCLGTYGPYKGHFGGCDDEADGELLFFQALTKEGVTFEENFPYQSNDPGSCTHWDDPRVVFDSWSRCGCLAVDRIKAAILKYGAVAAGVLCTPAFEAYNEGVYEDTLAGCPTEDGVPCWYAPMDHLVALVGWNDNGDPEKEGYWILRNSWGDDWGEGGYMRIKYNSAHVSCATAYITMGKAPGTPAGTTPHYVIFFLLLTAGGLVYIERRRRKVP